MQLLKGILEKIELSAIIFQHSGLQDGWTLIFVTFNYGLILKCLCSVAQYQILLNWKRGLYNIFTTWTLRHSSLLLNMLFISFNL